MEFVLLTLRKADHTLLFSVSEKEPFLASLVLHHHPSSEYLLCQWTLPLDRVTHISRGDTI